MNQTRPLGLGCHIFVTDADAAVAFYRTAFGASELFRNTLPDDTLQAGAEVEMPISEMFWGERYGIVGDPFGHRWALCTRREQLDPDEVASRMHADATSDPTTSG